MIRSRQGLYETYIHEYINSSDMSVQAIVKEEKNHMYKSASKQQSVKVRDGIIDLKETKDLYSQLVVVAKSN